MKPSVLRPLTAPLLSSVSGFLQFLYQTSRANRRRRVSVADVWHWAKPSSEACRVAALEFFGVCLHVGLHLGRVGRGGTFPIQPLSPSSLFSLCQLFLFFSLFGGT